MRLHDTSVDMTHGPLLKKLIVFALPLTLTSILQQLFNSADTAVVGRFVSSQAQAAVGANSYVISLLVTTFVGVSVGANVAASRYLATDNDKKTQETVHTSILLALIIGLMIIAAGEVLARFMLTLISTPSDILDQAILYLRIYFLGVPFEMIYNFGSALLRSKGDSRRPLISLFLSGILNVFLNLFFVIVCRLSVAGVAIATVLSNGVACFLVLHYLAHEDGALKLSFKKLGIEPRIMKMILSIGLPAGLQGALFSISNVCIQSAINSFGSDAVAGASIGQYFDLYTYFFSNGFAQACVTFTSQNYAVGKEDRCRKIFAMCMACGLAFCFCVGSVFLLGRRTFLRLYSTDDAVLRFASLNLLHRTFFEFLEVPFDVAGSSLRGHGYSLTPTVLTVVGTCLFRLWWVFVLFPGSHDFGMLMNTYSASWILTDAMMLAAYFIMESRVRKNAAYHG